MRTIRPFFLLLAGILIAGLTACGGGGGGGATTTPDAGAAGALAAANAPLAVNSFTPSTAVEGSTVTVQGAGLTRVQQVCVGNQQASGVVIDSALQLRFVVPTGAASGAIRLVESGAEASSLGSLAVLPQPVVQGLSPSQARAGDSLSLTGTALENIDQVLVGGVGVAPVNRSSTSVQAVVPATAANGTLALRLVDGSQRTVAQSFTLLPPLSVVTSMSPTSVQEGTLVTVSGSYLNNATQVLVGGSAVTLSSQSANSLSFSAPSRDGVVELVMVDGVRVNAGSLSLLSAPPVRIERVEVAQNYSQLVRGSYQSLVPNKAAWLRVFVVADNALRAPTVTATLSNCPAQGTLTLTGPAQLPTSTPARTSLEQTFTTAIPASCVQNGMQAHVTVANSNPRNGGASVSVQPYVSGNTGLNLVLVPLATNGATGRVPDTTTLRRTLARLFPLEANRIIISVRAPFTLSTTQVVNGTQWRSALNELQQLWASEGQGRHYFGMVANRDFLRGTGGIGYQNTSSSRPWLVGMGLDEDALGLEQALLTLAHELGHNWSLPHAPCGEVSDYDEYYPYPNATLGSNSPVFESDSDRDGTVGPLAVYFPSAPYLYDLMSYCRSQGFSDYNYTKVQGFLSSFSYPSVAPYTSERTLLDFRGQLGANQSVLMAPPSARSTRQPYTGTGAHTLRIHTAQGQVLDTPFQAVAVADGGATVYHFQASVPDPGAIERIEVLHQDRPLAVQLDAPTPTAKAWASGVEAKEVPGVQWQESEGRLLLSWDASRYPVLQVRHRSGEHTTLLATRLMGGHAQVDLGPLPAGGQWEFSLSSGWNAQLVRQARQP